MVLDENGGNEESGERIEKKRETVISGKKREPVGKTKQRKEKGEKRMEREWLINRGGVFASASLGKIRS